jgi:hypothetical protein
MPSMAAPAFAKPQLSNVRREAIKKMFAATLTPLDKHPRLRPPLPWRRQHRTPGRRGSLVGVAASGRGPAPEDASAGRSWAVAHDGCSLLKNAIQGSYCPRPSENAPRWTKSWTAWLRAMSLCRNGFIALMNAVTVSESSGGRNTVTRSERRPAFGRPPPWRRGWALLRLTVSRERIPRTGRRTFVPLCRFFVVCHLYSDVWVSSEHPCIAQSVSAKATK